MYRAFFSEGRPVSSLTFRRFATASPSYLFRPGLATAQAGPASVAVVVVVLEPEDHVARPHSGGAVAASVAQLAVAPSEVPVAPAVGSCAVVDYAALEVAVAALLSALVDVLVFLLALPGLVPVVELLRQHAQRSAVEFELASAAAELASAAARVAAFAGEHLYCLELPRQRSGPSAACGPRLVHLDRMFELLPPVAHP